MFFRVTSMDNGDARWAGVIENLYQRMDRLLGKAMEQIDDQTILFALSDHGFCAFRRAVNLNSWLHRHGYLALAGDSQRRAGDIFKAPTGAARALIAWDSAGSISTCVSDLESCGIVAPGGEAEMLKRELVAKLSRLTR